LIDGLPRDFPTLRTLDAHPNNLPSQPTPLLGREKELQSGVEMLRRRDVRLLSLLGPGGTGKTRLSLQVAAELLHEYANGVFWVDLAPVVNTALVPQTILQALGVSDAAGQDASQTLTEYLRDKNLLLLLDNFEQILEAAPTISALLQNCANIKVIVTSRTPLRIRGEQEFPVPPLALPIRKPPPTTQQLSQYAAVQLFIQRAQSVKPGFGVSAENAPAIAEICVRLDGLPLAIELAAARVKLLSPQALLARLEKSLNVLTGGARDVAARQQTLRGAIAWSHDLLDEDERRLFRRLGVFMSGTTLEAIEAVCNSTNDLSLDVLDGVCSLCDKSLLKQSESEDGEPRFWMLETIREYSIEQLESSGEANSMQQAHAAHFLELADTAHLQLSLPDAALWLQRLQAEQENLRTAFNWSLRNEPLTALRLAHLLSLFWSGTGRGTQAREWLHQGLSAAPDAPPHEIRKALEFQMTHLGTYADRHQQKQVAERLLSLSREHNWPSTEGHTLNVLSKLAHYDHNKALALQLVEEAQAVTRKHLDVLRASPHTEQELKVAEIYTAATHAGAAINMYLNGKCDEAIALFKEALRDAQRLVAPHATVWMLNQLADMLISQERYGEAKAYLLQSLQQLLPNDTAGLGWTLHALSKVAISESNVPEVHTYATESLQAFKEVGELAGITYTLLAFCWLACAQSQWTRAAHLLGMEETLRAQIELEEPPHEWREHYACFVRDTRAALSESEYAAAHATGRAMTVEQIIEYALNEDKLS
jgi:predicted ATPase